MAIGHLHASVVQRSAGQTAVHAAAYAARARMVDERTGAVYDYSRKNADVLFSFVGLPKGAPENLQDVAAFANALETRETRCNSQTARKFIMALPHELTPQQREWLVKDFGRENFTRKGLAYHVAIHRPHTHGDHRNVHAHWTVSTRTMEKGVFTEKDRDSNSKEALLAWRDSWEKLVNRHLERHGHQTRISMQTLEEQGIDRTPQIHLGQGASALERKGKITSRGDQLRDIANDNGPEPEPEEELEFVDRDQQEAAWQTAMMDGAAGTADLRAAAAQEQMRADLETREAAWQKRKAARFLQQVERVETRLGIVSADLQDRHLTERSKLLDQAQGNRRTLQDQLAQEYDGHVEQLAKDIAVLSRQKRHFPRLWAKLTGREKADAERLAAARRSLHNIERRRAERLEALQDWQQTAEWEMTQRHQAEVRNLEQRPDRQDLSSQTERFRDRYADQFAEIIEERRLEGIRLQRFKQEQKGPELG